MRESEHIYVAQGRGGSGGVWVICSKPPPSPRTFLIYGNFISKLNQLIDTIATDFLCAFGFDFLLLLFLCALLAYIIRGNGAPVDFCTRFWINFAEPASHIAHPDQLASHVYGADQITSYPPCWQMCQILIRPPNHPLLVKFE